MYIPGSLILRHEEYRTFAQQLQWQGEEEKWRIYTVEINAGTLVNNYKSKVQLRFCLDFAITWLAEASDSTLLQWGRLRTWKGIVAGSSTWFPTTSRWKWCTALVYMPQMLCHGHQWKINVAARHPPYVCHNNGMVWLSNAELGCAVTGNRR